MKDSVNDAIARRLDEREAYEARRVGSHAWVLGHPSSSLLRDSGMSVADYLEEIEKDARLENQCRDALDAAREREKG